MIGAAREYELTGETRYRDIARFFWDRVALHRSYVIGGHSDREYFFPVTEFRRHLSAETAETCNTYNMLKLTRRLFAWEPDAREMDFYERGLYNHILASQEPGRGMFVYLMALEAGRFKTYSTAEDSFWCCVGTGMENHAQYGEAIFAHGTDDLFVNLLIGAEVDWKAKGVTLRQETAFPDQDGTRLTWQAREPVALTLRVRHPAWARGPLTVAINGTPVEVGSEPGSYAAIARTWRTGDVVDVRFPMDLQVETLPGAPDQVALLYGPIVLAGRLGTDGVPSPYAEEQTAHVRFPPPDVPHFVTSDTDWLSRVQLVSRRPLLFRTRGLAQPRDVVLEPFFRVHHERYAVYWTVLSPERWAERQTAIADVTRRVDALPRRVTRPRHRRRRHQRGCARGSGDQLADGDGRRPDLEAGTEPRGVQLSPRHEGCESRGGARAGLRLRCARQGPRLLHPRGRDEAGRARTRRRGAGCRAAGDLPNPAGRLARPRHDHHHVPGRRSLGGRPPPTCSAVG